MRRTRISRVDSSMKRIQSVVEEWNEAVSHRTSFTVISPFTPAAATLFVGFLCARIDTFEFRLHFAICVLCGCEEQGGWRGTRRRYCESFTASPILSSEKSTGTVREEFDIYSDRSATIV